MTFEEKLELAVELNKKIVAGQKVGQIATSELIRTDALPAEDLAELVFLYPKWNAGLTVQVGDLYAFNDTLYEVIQAHTTQADWTPDATPALWKSKAPVGIIPEWKQPTGGHDAYQAGDKVLFNSKTYESLIDANTWDPATYPAGWKEI